MDEQVIPVKIHFGGHIEYANPNFRYVGGDVFRLGLDIDKASYFELVDYVWDLKFYEKKNFTIYAVIPREGGLKLLVDDRDVTEIVHKVQLNNLDELDIYVHVGPDIATMTQPNSEPNKAQEQPISVEPKSPTLHFNSEQPLRFQSTPISERKYTKQTARKHCPDVLPVIQPNDIDEEDGSGDEEDGSGDDDSQDETYEINLNDEEGGSDDEEWKDSVELLKKVNREDVESQQKVIDEVLKQPEEGQLGKLVEFTGCSSSNHIQGESSYEDSDGDVHSPGDSEDDNIRGKKYIEIVPVVDENTDFAKFKWVVGTRFATREAFKKVVQKYAVTNGRNLKISTSNKKRLGKVGVSCVEGCPFRLLCSFHTGKGCFMVKSVKNRHNCQRNMHKNRQLTQDFIAEEFLPIFKARPNWPAKEIQLAVKEKYKVLIGKWIAYKAKGCAHKKLHGSMRDHYSKIGSYVAALKDANPTSTFVLVTVPPVPESEATCASFFRFFVCFDGVKKGFLAGCRKVLCLDGCFLKTFLGGMLLAAIGRDGNDQMYPLAWAVVEGENNDSWEWFMDELYKCLGINNGGKGWTLISDQQKGLLNAVHRVWNNAEHRNCARHIYANWHKNFKGEDLKGAFWKACRAYNEADYKDAIQEMTELSKEGVDAFTKQNPKAFSRCFLNNETKCDVIVNNMAETFNGYIVHARSKHIIHMLEDIRVSIMARLTKMKSTMLVKELIVCPRIQQKLDKEKYWSYKCEVYPLSLNVFQVRDFEDLSVDLMKKTCTCRKWDLTGIPCKHVCAVAGFLGKTAEDFVHEWYHKEQYMKAYEFTIPPLPIERFWPTVVAPLDPPPIKIQPGRPKKNRKRDPHEDPKKPGKLTKHGIQMKCSHSKSTTHNIRKCGEKAKGTPKVTGETSTRGRGRGRPRGRGRGRSTVGSTQVTENSTQATQPSNPTQQSIRSKRQRGSQGARGNPRGKST